MSVISESEYKQLSKDLQKDKENYELVVESNHKELTKINERIQSEDDKLKQVKKYVNLDVLTKEIVDELID